MKKAIHISLLLIFIFRLPAQSLVTGKITDAKDHNILIGATVNEPQTHKGAVTDENGEYRLLLPKGKYELSFSYLGYKTQKTIIDLDGNSAFKLNIDLQDSVGASLQMVVVSESRYAKKLEESISSIDIIAPAVIASNQVNTLSDVVQRVPGVQVNDGQVNIRSGAGYAFGTGSRVMFMVDEQPLLSADLGDVKWNFVPIENTAQVEVIKGAASVLYGSGALNGVINVRTALPTEEPYTNVTVYGGLYSMPSDTAKRWWKGLSDNPYVSGVFFSTRRKLGKDNQFDWVFGGNLHAENGYIIKDNERRIRLNNLFRWKVPGYDGRLVAGLRVNGMYYGRPTYTLWKDNGHNAFMNVDTSNSSYSPDNFAVFNIDPFLSYYEKNGTRHEIRASVFTVIKVRNPQQNSFVILPSLEYQLHKELPKGYNFIGGVLGRYLHAKSVFHDSDSSNRDGLVFEYGYNTAVYAQVDKKFFDKLSLNVGTRWEAFYFGRQWDMPLPIFRFGGNYQLSNTNYIRASFGQGYRFPSLSERYLSLSIPGTPLGVIPNPDLKPESGWTAEIGYKKTWFAGNAWKGYSDIALYWMEYRNMTEFSFDFWGSTAGFKSVNISQARIAGMELTMYGEGKIGNFPLQIMAGYNYSFPADLVSDPGQKDIGNFISNFGKAFIHGVNSELINSQSILKYRNLHTARLDIESGYKKLTFGGAANYTSFMIRIDPVFEIFNGIGDYRNAHHHGDWIFDLRAGWRFTDKLHASFIVNNIFNTEYALRPGKMNATRLISFKVSCNF